MAFLSGRLNVNGNGRCKGRGGAFSLAVFFIKTCFWPRPKHSADVPIASMVLHVKGFCTAKNY